MHLLFQAFTISISHRDSHSFSWKFLKNDSPYSSTSECLDGDKSLCKKESKIIMKKSEKLITMRKRSEKRNEEIGWITNKGRGNGAGLFFGSNLSVWERKRKRFWKRNGLSSCTSRYENSEDRLWKNSWRISGLQNPVRFRRSFSYVCSTNPRDLIKTTINHLLWFCCQAQCNTCSFPVSQPGYLNSVPSAGHCKKQIRSAFWSNPISLE